MSTKAPEQHTKWQEATTAIDNLCDKFDAGALTQKDRAVFVLGNANAGKTCFLDWYAARYKEKKCIASAAENDDYTTYSPVVTIKTPFRPDIPNLANAIFVSIFGEVRTLPKQWHEGSYVKTAREQMEEIGCRLLLVDEAQQLTHIKDDQDRTQVIDFIKGFIDGVPCPIVFAGLPAVRDLLSDAQIKARTFDWNFAKDRVGMMVAIELLCKELGLEHENSAELATRMWAATQGGFGDFSIRGSRRLADWLRDKASTQSLQDFVQALEPTKRTASYELAEAAALTGIDVPAFLKICFDEKIPPIQPNRWSGQQVQLIRHFAQPELLMPMQGGGYVPDRDLEPLPKPRRTSRRRNHPEGAEYGA